MPTKIVSRRPSKKSSKKSRIPTRSISKGIKQELQGLLDARKSLEKFMFGKLIRILDVGIYHDTRNALVSCNRTFLKLRKVAL